MKPKQAQRRIAEKHIKPSKTITQQIAEGCHSETTQPEKPKPKRQRKHMEMSVYNKLIDQLNELKSENKRLKESVSEGDEVIAELEGGHRRLQSALDEERILLRGEISKQKARKQLYRAACIFLTGVAIVLSYYAI